MQNTASINFVFWRLFLFVTWVQPLKCRHPKDHIMLTCQQILIRYATIDIDIILLEHLAYLWVGRFSRQFLVTPSVQVRMMLACGAHQSKWFNTKQPRMSWLEFALVGASCKHSIRPTSWQIQVHPTHASHVLICRRIPPLSSNVILPFNLQSSYTRLFLVSPVYRVNE